MNESSPTVGWVGLGAIGLPMAVRAAEAGWQVWAYDAVAQRCEVAREAGIAIAADTAEVGRRAPDLVVCVVRSLQQVGDTLLGKQGALRATPGGLGIVMSSVGATGIGELGTRAGELGSRLLDAPILGNPMSAADGSASLVVSGAADDVAEALPLLNDLSNAVFVLGEVLGAAQAMKMTSQVIQIGRSRSRPRRSTERSQAMSAQRLATTHLALHGDLTGIVGKHLIYAYENGWKYELYVRDAQTIELRSLMGPMFGRWSKNQTAKLVQLSDDMYKIAWVEPTGTTTVLIVWLGDRRVHTTISYPQWMLDYPDCTLTRYEENLDAIIAERDRGPTYPLTLVSASGRITFLESRDLDDDTVINCPPHKLPPGYATRTN